MEKTEKRTLRVLRRDDHGRGSRRSGTAPSRTITITNFEGSNLQRTTNSEACRRPSTFLSFQIGAFNVQTNSSTVDVPQTNTGNS